ncbi:FUSC family protein [Humibacter albus]|uniref:FUSC family protein n=1 Tax=Humibacter albus TaxID=427754 RepID=UPI0003B7635F|nr:FUSC family protein [Humibacter albus]
MDAVWIAFGIAVLAFTLLDTFLVVLNYNEPGFFANKVARAEWIAIRSFTRRVSRRWRPLVLRQVTGSLILTTLLCWLVGLVLGFAFIYLGLIGLGAFQLSTGVKPDFVGAFYLSVGQFSTAGADNISPAGGWVNLIPVAEALLSVVILSFFITFLSNIFSVIQNLRSLCADFFQVGPGVGSPVEALRPFFPGGRSRGLDLHLTNMVNDFNLYCDSLRQDRAAYHFQSGEDRFSLPYALHMVAGEAGALQWGLPAGHAASQSPQIVRLIEAFSEFRDDRYVQMGWQSRIAPAPLSRERFVQERDAYSSHRLDVQLDPWAARFFALNDAMVSLAHDSIPDVPDDAYVRYVGWLPFASAAHQFVSDVGHDLDFQPIYRDDPSVPAVVTSSSDEDVTQDADAGSEDTPRRSRVASWLRRRQAFLDPGFVRTRSALRTLVIVIVAAGIATGIAAGLSISATTAGALAGLVAMFASSSSTGRQEASRRVGLIGLIATFGGITCGVLLPQASMWTMLALAALAAIAVWLSRFGPMAGSFGRLLFITAFFASLLEVEPQEYVAAFIASGIGVVCSWIASFLPTRSPRARLRDAVHAFFARSASVLDAAADSVTTGRDPAIDRRLRAAALALRDTAAHLATSLDLDRPPAGLSETRARMLRLRVFEADLAAQGLVRALSSGSDYAITVDVGAVLAGELVALQRHIISLEHDDSDTPFAVHATPRPDWSEESQRALAGIRETAAAFDRLSAARRGAEEAAPMTPSTARETKPARAARAVQDQRQRGATDRRALQSGLAVALALFLGEFVSSGAQYWAALPAYQSLAAADGFSWKRNLQRGVSTVAGAAVAFGLTLATGHSPVTTFTVLGVTVFLTVFLRTVASSWTVFWQTILLATMYDALSALDVEAVQVRIVETLIGAAIALLVSALVLPTRVRANTVTMMSNAIAAAMASTHATLGRLADPSAVDASSADALESQMDRQFREIHAAARPLRNGAGSMGRGGIEAQLVSLWALLYYVHRLSCAGAMTGPSAITPTQWQQLDASTRDNFQAALAVLDNRAPSRIRDVRDADTSQTDGMTPDERELLEDITRINEVLLTYVDDVAIGSTDTLIASRT